MQQDIKDIWPWLCLCVGVCLFSLYIFLNEYYTLPVCRLAAAEGSGPRCMREEEEEEESSEEEEQLSPEEQGGSSGFHKIAVLNLKKVLHWFKRLYLRLESATILMQNRKRKRETIRETNE